MPRLDVVGQISGIGGINQAGQFVPDSVWCNGSCDWTALDAVPDGTDQNGSTVGTAPLSDLPPPEEQCQTFPANVSDDNGGGFVRIRLCPSNGDWVFDGCQDFPNWGPPLSMCQ